MIKILKYILESENGSFVLFFINMNRKPEEYKLKSPVTVDKNALLSRFGFAYFTSPSMRHNHQNARNIFLYAILP